MGKRIEKPLVSVVIPTYNRANELRRCLESLRAQTWNAFEVLICDDGSTDNTAEIWAEYSALLDITYDRSENFGGPARPRNRGIALARAPYIAFLDSDDWWAPRKLEVSFEYLERGADLVYHDLFLSTKSHVKHPWRKQQTRRLRSPAFEDLIVNGNGITNSSVVVRKPLLEQIGGFSEDRDLIAAEDYDAWLRIARLTENLVRIPDTLGYYYWTTNGNISNPTRIVANLVKLEIRFADAIAALERNWNIFWIKYQKGRSYYRLKSYGLARESLESIRWRGTPPSIYWKSKFIAAWIRLRHGARA